MTTAEYIQRLDEIIPEEVPGDLPMSLVQRAIICTGSYEAKLRVWQQLVDDWKKSQQKEVP